MEELLFIAYEILSGFLPALFVYMIITSLQKRKGLPRTKGSLAALIVFSGYIGLVFAVTGAGTLYDVFRVGFHCSPDELNLIPFQFDSYPAQYTMNATMFVPLGILLPLIWTSCRKVWITVAYGAGFSLLLELSQLFTRRVTDIDDLIMNTLGALIGFGIYYLFKGAKEAKASTETGVIEIPGTNENVMLPALYIATLFFGHFFLYNGIGLAGVLYGI